MTPTIRPFQTIKRGKFPPFVTKVDGVEIPYVRKIRGFNRFFGPLSAKITVMVGKYPILDDTMNEILETSFIVKANRVTFEPVKMTPA